MTTVSSDLSGRTVVFLHAHPDDEAIFTGITMRRLADRGARVVLVTATSGEEGEPLAPLPPGTSVGATRVAELETACAMLGVARLVVWPFRDSGMPGAAANAHPRAFAADDVSARAAALADLLLAEHAETLVHYDDAGIYGHPDHVAVHRVGTAAAVLAGAAAYESTVDREHLHFVAPHLVEGDLWRLGRAGRRPQVGRVTVEIPTALRATPAELAAKRSAMAAHASQIPAAALTARGFADTYALEWFLRPGPVGLLDALGNAHVTALSA